MASVLLGAACLRGADVQPLAYQQCELPNGVRVLVAEKHDVPVVAVRAFVQNTGGMLEGRFTGCGVSHFIEHIAAAMLKDLGSVVNAYTTADHTCYHCETGVEDWETAAQAIGECLHACPFDPAIVERERGVIVREIRMGEEEPGRVAWNQLLETVLRNSPQRVPVIGYHDNFVRVTREELLDYYHERYAANNIVVAIAGAVTAADARRVAARAFGAIPRRPDSSAIIVPEARPLSPRVAMRRMPVQHAYVNLAWHAAPLGHTDQFVFDVLSRMLSQGESSLLVHDLRTTRQLVYDVSASTWVPWTGNALFILSFSCDETNTAAATEAVLAALQHLAHSPPDAALVARAQRAATLDYARNTQTASAIAATLANNLLAYGDSQFSTRYLRYIESVSADDVARVVRDYCTTDSMTTTLLLPLAATHAAPVAAAAPVPPAAWCLTQLCNGVRIAVKPDARVPLVEFSLYMPGGLICETPANNGISTLCAAMLTKGTRTRTARHIACELDARGAELSYDATRDALRGTASCAPADTTFILELLADTALASTFPADELEKQRRLCQGAVAALRDNWSQEAMLNFQNVFFAGHPYAMPLAGSSNALATLTRDDLRAFHMATLQPSNIVIAIAGDCNAEAVIQQCAESFGALAPLAAPLPRATRHRPAAPRPFETAPTPRAQATVILGFPAPAVPDDDMPMVSVMRAMLGGLNGLVFSALRGTTNLAYVASAMYMAEPDAGAVLCLAQCAPHDAPLVITLITNVFARLAAGEIDEQLLARARSDVLALFYRDRQTLGAQAGDAARWLYRGQGLEQAQRFPARIAAVTAADIQAAAARYAPACTCVITTPNDPVQRAHEFLQRYPHAAPQDLYKVIMQGVNGPAHLAPDGARIEADLQREWAALTPAHEPLWQPIAINNDWGWLDLRAWKHHGGSLEPVQRALWRSIHAPRSTMMTVSQAWQHVAAAARAGTLPLDRATFDAYDAWLAQHNYPPVHHTPEFIERYQPAYRVLSRSAWDAAQAATTAN